MCLERKNKTLKIAKEDIYVLKYGQKGTTNKEFFCRIRKFTYLRGVMMSKEPSDRIKAYKSKSLEGEVFHAFSPGRTDYLMASIGTRSITERRYFGVFMIPAGALYWLGAAGDDIGSTEIMYMGNTNEVCQLIKPGQCV